MVQSGLLVWYGPDLTVQINLIQTGRDRETSIGPGLISAVRPPPAVALVAVDSSRRREKNPSHRLSNRRRWTEFLSKNKFGFRRLSGDFPATPIIVFDKNCMEIIPLVKIYLFVGLDSTFDSCLKNFKIWKSIFDRVPGDETKFFFGKAQGQNWNKKVVKNWAFIFFTLMRVKHA